MNIVISIGNRYRFSFGIIYKHIEPKRSDAYLSAQNLGNLLGIFSIDF